MKHLKFLGLSVCLFMLAFGGLTLAQDQLEPVDIIMWTTERDEPIIQAYQDLFDQWAAAFAPGSTIEITYVETEQMRNDLLTAGLSGSGLPDLFLGPNDPIGVYVDAGLVQPVDELVDLSIYTEGAVQAAQLDGVTYGVPMNAGNHIMLLYNTDYVTEAPQTWAELIETARAVEEANPDVQGFAYNLNEPFWFLPFVHGLGGSTFDAEGSFTLDSQAWVDAFRFVQDLKFTEEVSPEECDYDCMNSLFSEGGAAMILNGDWSLGAYLDSAQAPALGADKLGIAPWPAFDNGQRPMPFVSGRYISLPVTTEGAKLDAILSWLNWLTTDNDAILAYTASIGRLPAITTANELPEVADDPVLAASAEALATGMGMPANVELRCMWDAVRPQLEGVMANAVTPEDAAAEAQASAEACVADLE